MVFHNTCMNCVWIVLAVTLNVPLYKIISPWEYHARSYISGPKNVKHFSWYHPRVRQKNRKEICNIFAFTAVDTIQSAFVFLDTKKLSNKKICIWRKQVYREIPCDVVHLFIALVIIEISFDLSLSVGNDSIETHTLTNNVKLFNEWITQKRQNQ